MPSRRTFLRSALSLSGGLLAACSTSPSLPSPTPTAQVPTISPAPQVTVLASGLDFPEGPAFDPQGRLWCTELLGGTIVLLQDDTLQRILVGGGPGGRANGLAFDSAGRAWVTDSGRNAIQRYDPASGQWKVILDQVDGSGLLTPNDLCFDAAGNLLFTCPNFASTEPTGYVVCLSPDGSAKKIVEGYYRPNGLDIVDGGKSLVVADTYRKTLYKGAWDDTARAWKDPQPWARVGGSEGPDGMAPGADGQLYQAIYGDGVIRVVGADGQVEREIPVPGANPTNVAVDPSGKLGIVVTETEKGQLLSLQGIQPGAAVFDGGSAWK